MCRCCQSCPLAHFICTSFRICGRSCNELDPVDGTKKLRWGYAKDLRIDPDSNLVMVSGRVDFYCGKALVGNAVVLFDSCISYVLLMCCADVSFVCTSMLMDMICLLVEAHETHPDLKSKGVKYIADQMRTETFKEDFEDAIS